MTPILRNTLSVSRKTCTNAHCFFSNFFFLCCCITCITKETHHVAGCFYAGQKEVFIFTLERVWNACYARLMWATYLMLDATWISFANHHHSVRFYNIYFVSNYAKNIYIYSHVCLCVSQRISFVAQTPLSRAASELINFGLRILQSYGDLYIYSLHIKWNRNECLAPTYTKWKKAIICQIHWTPPSTLSVFLFWHLALPSSVWSFSVCNVQCHCKSEVRCSKQTELFGFCCCL